MSILVLPGAEGLVHILSAGNLRIRWIKEDTIRYVAEDAVRPPGMNIQDLYRPGHPSEGPRTKDWKESPQREIKSAYKLRARSDKSPRLLTVFVCPACHSVICPFHFDQLYFSESGQTVLQTISTSLQNICPTIIRVTMICFRLTIKRSKESILQK